jgi:transposase
MGKIRRKFEAEFKRQLIAQIEAGHKTVAQAAREQQISRSLIDRWRTQYHNNVLVDRPSSRERQLEAENEKLKAKVGDLVMQMDHIKKLQTWVQRQKNADTSVITAKNLDRFRKPAK